MLKFLRDILPVLQYIHQQGLLHRDIKPENIMRRHEDGKIFLIDFGGVKQHLKTVSVSGTALFTPGYAAYEQTIGQPRHSSDIYSLGATCVRLLTGHLPAFGMEGNIQDELYDANEARWLWREKGGKVRGEFGQILDKMLEHSPKRRYQRVKELTNALGNITSPKKKTFSFPTVAINKSGKIIKGQQRKAEYIQEDLGNKISLEMIKIPGGTFIMGSPPDEAERFAKEGPQHEVTILPFHMSKYTITQAQWQAIMGNNPASFKGENRPVESVSWFDAVEFCQKLSKKSGKEYRLPSEAEWEYACRAGTTTPFHFGTTITTKLANYNGNFSPRLAPRGKNRKETTEVGSFAPNAFGLYDMHGNVWEWCYDQWYEPNESYEGAPGDGSPWLVEDSNDNYRRVLRGGSWHLNPKFCRSACRASFNPDYRYIEFGFRIVCADAGTP